MYPSIGGGGCRLDWLAISLKVDYGYQADH
jgi:hypothetical protein